MSEKMSSTRAFVDRAVSVERGTGVDGNPTLTIDASSMKVDVIPLSSLSLILKAGKVDNTGEFLWPLVDLRLIRQSVVEGAEPEEPSMELAFSAFIVFDNLAFLLMDIAKDLKGVCAQLAQISQGEISAEPDRMGLTKGWLRSASSLLNECSNELERIPNRTPPARTASSPKSRSTRSIGRGERRK